MRKRKHVLDADLLKRNAAILLDRGAGKRIPSLRPRVRRVNISITDKSKNIVAAETNRRAGWRRDWRRDIDKAIFNAVVEVFDEVPQVDDALFLGALEDGKSFRAAARVYPKRIAERLIAIVDAVIEQTVFRKRKKIKKLQKKT